MYYTIYQIKFLKVYNITVTLNVLLKYKMNTINNKMYIEFIIKLNF